MSLVLPWGGRRYIFLKKHPSFYNLARFASPPSLRVYLFSQYRDCYMGEWIPLQWLLLLLPRFFEWIILLPSEKRRRSVFRANTMTPYRWHCSYFSYRQQWTVKSNKLYIQMHLTPIRNQPRRWDCWSDFFHAEKKVHSSRKWRLEF